MKKKKRKEKRTNQAEQIFNIDIWLFGIQVHAKRKIKRFFIFYFSLKADFMRFIYVKQLLTKTKKKIWKTISKSCRRQILLWGKPVDFIQEIAPIIKGLILPCTLYSGFSYYFLFYIIFFSSTSFLVVVILFFF